MDTLNINVVKITKQEYKNWLLNRHYARRIPPIQYAFGLLIDNKLNGVCCYGPPPE